MTSFTEPSLVPPTQLPVDHKALSRYLRSRQLAALRHLYEYKTLAVTQQIEEHAASQRGRHGRARRRRGSTPPVDPREVEVEEEEDDLEVRKKMRYDPPGDDELDEPSPPGQDEPESSTAPAKRAAAAAAVARELHRREDDDAKVDPAHVYDYVFDLAPEAGSDAYYHGVHPPPPARVVHTVLRATRKKPFVDPSSLSTAQLETLTRELWTSEGLGLPVTFGGGGSSSTATGRRKRAAEQPLSRDQERYQRELHAEAADEWEHGVIAAFAATCDERIGEALARKPMTAREMQAQAQLQAAQQQAEAQQRQQQQGQPGAGPGVGQQQGGGVGAQAQAGQVAGLQGYAGAPSLSPYVERDRFIATSGAPAWRW